MKALAAGFAKVEGGASSRKEARKVVGGLDRASTGLVAAWDEAMRWWKELSGVIFARGDEDEEGENGRGHRRESSESSRSPEVSFDRLALSDTLPS